MLSIEQCREILNAGERKYSEEEIIKIRDFVYQLAKIDVEFFMREKNKNSERDTTENEIQS